MKPTKEERLARLGVFLTMKALADAYKHSPKLRHSSEGLERINLALLKLMFVLDNKPIKKREALRTLADLSAQGIRFMVDLVLSKNDKEEIK